MYFDDSFVPSDFVQIVGDYVDTEQLVEQPKIIEIRYQNQKSDVKLRFETKKYLTC